MHVFKNFSREQKKIKQCPTWTATQFALDRYSPQFWRWYLGTYHYGRKTQFILVCKRIHSTQHWRWPCSASYSSLYSTTFIIDHNSWWDTIEAIRGCQRKESRRDDAQCATTWPSQLGWVGWPSSIALACAWPCAVVNKMFTKVGAIADIHTPIFGPVFS